MRTCDDGVRTKPRSEPARLGAGRCIGTFANEFMRPWAAPTVMAHFALTLSVKENTRAEQRRRVVETWLAERPGTTAERHTYRYDVETLSNGRKIYIKRPARLNKGMDFVIYCEGWLKNKTNPNDKPPSFRHLLDAITTFANPSGSRDLVRLTAIHDGLRRVWQCEPPETVQSADRALDGNVDAERILKLAKWFFIEQDLTYWTESGREMLMLGIDAHVNDLR